MSDERIVKVIAEAIHKFNKPKTPAYRILNALRADGWDLYRPEEETVTVVCFFGCSFVARDTPLQAHQRTEAHYGSKHGDELRRLVPVSEGTEPQ